MTSQHSYPAINIMQTLETLKRKIASTQELQTVAKTMKALAAANIRQYEQAANALQHYRQTLAMAIQILRINYPDTLTHLRPRAQPRLGIVIFGSDQGMCGRFNEQLLEMVIQHLEQHSSQGEQPLLLGMGARICDRIIDQGYAIERDLSVPTSVDGITSKVQTIVVQLEQWRTQCQVDQIWVFHNQPIRGHTSTPHRQQLFPLEFDLGHPPSWPTRCRPMVFLSRERLFSAIFRQHFFVALYQACAESLASENASRLTSMQLAQTNIAEHLTELQAAFQQQRQTKITEELLDIVSGFEALNQPH